MSVKPLKVQFNGGELSPWLYGRVDIAKFDKTAKLCRNFIPLAEGSLKRRGGTRFAAKTKTESSLLFSIRALPSDAVVLINGARQNFLRVARGDTVYYEVYGEGYTPIHGKMMVVQNTTLNINLVSQYEQHTLTIVPTPASALVKIAGRERTSYKGFQNEEVSYIVSANGYTLQTGTVILDSDKTIEVVLETAKEEEIVGEYGDWGNPIGFIACTAYGNNYARQKCILIRFSNGYLPILFDANRIAPSDSDVNESLFMYVTDDGYDTLVQRVPGGPNQLAWIQWGSDAIRYFALDGSLIWGIDYLSMMITGWPIDEYNRYAATYTTYDGGVSGNAVRIYYQGDLVWTLKGRNHG